MCVYLYSQLSSNHVIELIADYAKDDNDLKKEYLPLRSVMQKVDCLIDIWNHYSKKYSLLTINIIL